MSTKTQNSLMYFLFVYLIFLFVVIIFPVVIGWLLQLIFNVAILSFMAGLIASVMGLLLLAESLPRKKKNENDQYLCS